MYRVLVWSRGCCNVPNLLSISLTRVLTAESPSPSLLFVCGRWRHCSGPVLSGDLSPASDFPLKSLSKIIVQTTARQARLNVEEVHLRRTCE